MNNVYFDVYRDDIIKLVRSVIIKYSETADQINARLLQFDGLEVDQNEPTTWKYYMHLAGEYHSTDVMMYVKSADTLEMIEFTKANLAIHRATAREYYPGSILYKSLVRQYPTQADLITGILYPIDIQTAIDAEDGKILYHDPKYVEAQEDTFIYDLQDWVNAFYIRWYNDQFNIVDDLFHAAYLGNLYSRMVPAILAMRLAKAKTNNAHSYHIREYLASHEHLDDFIPYLDTFQMLWLYRNINFLQRHAGSKDTFQRLVQNILTHRGIPLLKYTLNQNSTNMLRDNLAHVEMVKHDVNFNVVQDGLAQVPVSTILEREQLLARDNPLVQFDTEREIMQDMGYSKSSILPTRVYDSEVIDRSVSNVRSLEHVLLNEWLQLASSDRYRAFVQIPNPKTGENMTMSVKDAYLVTMYCWMKSRGVLTDVIPRFIAYDVLLNKSPTFMELRKIAPTRLITNEVITAIQDLTPPMGQYISTEQFYLDCVGVHSRYLKQWELYSFQEHMVSRAYCEQVVRMHYMNRVCQLVPDNTTWDDYFRQQGFKITDMSNPEMEQLCLDAINIATGANLVKIITLGEVQRELLRLMSRMSSYIAQYLRNVEFTKFHVLGIVMPRLGDMSAHSGETQVVPIVNINVRDIGARGMSLIRLPDALIEPNISWSYKQSGTWWIDPCVNIVETSFKEHAYPMPVCNIGVGAVSIVESRTTDPDGDLEFYEESSDPQWPKFER
jgi:hypothetical protein